MNNAGKNKSAIFWGAVLIVVGVLLLLSTTRGMYIGDIISEYWPVLIIIFGIYLVVENRRKHRHEFDWNVGDKSFVSDKEKIMHSNTFGDINVTLDTKNFQGGEIRTVFGDIKTDLSKLDIVEGEQKLYLNCVFGDIKVNVPRDLALKIQANCTAGDIKIFDEKWGGLGQSRSYQSQNYEHASKKLYIIISHVFGDLKVW